MSEARQQQRPTRSRSMAEPVTTIPSQRTGWVGMVIFAAIMLLMLGGFQVIQGLVAIFNDDYYLVTSSGLLVDVDYSAWGWSHLAVGAAAICAGLGVLAGQVWARAVGVGVAFVSALVNVAFLAAYPLWSVMIITLDVLVIYALLVHGGEVRD